MATLSALEKWELRLRQALDEVDVQLESEFSGRIVLSPRRPPAGTTSSRKYDGLFAVNAMFSMGLATGNEPGYVIEVRVMSASRLDETLHEEVLTRAGELLPAAIENAFPGREMVLERQKDRFRLTGDLTL